MNYVTRTAKLTGNIAKTKNKLLKEMLKTSKNYLFLVENNCKVLDDYVYEKFIDTSKKTGVEALMWPRGAINKRLPFDDDKYIDYWTDFVSSFTMFTRNAVKTAGFFDEDMPTNTWQDLEYAKRIGDAGLSTPFGMFAAPKDIDHFFDIEKPKDEFKNLKAMDEALDYWQDKSMEDFPINIEREMPKKIQMI